MKAPEERETEARASAAGFDYGQMTNFSNLKFGKTGYHLGFQLPRAVLKNRRTAAVLMWVNYLLVMLARFRIRRIVPLSKVLSFSEGPYFNHDI